VAVAFALVNAPVAALVMLATPFVPFPTML